MEILNWISAGSVVKIKEYEEEILIIVRGFILPSETKFTYFDYYGVEMNKELHKAKNFIFNNEDIELIHFHGWNSDAQKINEQRFIEQVVEKGIQKAQGISEITALNTI